MKQRLHKLLQRRVVRYLIVGGSVYLLEVLIILVAQKLGASATLAVGLSFWIGLIISFGLQKLVAFEDKRTHHRIVLAQLLAMGLLVLFNFGFTITLTKLFANDLPAVVTRTIALAITATWNFYLYKTRIFKVPELEEPVF